MKTAFIVNKTAGRSRTSRIWPQLEQQLREKESDFSVFYTFEKGAGTDLARFIQEQGFQRIIVVGGDGTLHEVINGINPKQCVLGLIPTGTGNDFCRSMGIPLDPFTAANYVFSDSLCTIDLGCVNGRRFINVAGIGFDAEVAQKVNDSPMLQYISGTVAYLLAVFSTLFRYKNTPTEITTDGSTISGDIFLAAVGNARYYGGGMKIVPQALYDDGLFHLCIGQNISFFDALVILPKIFSGNHTLHPKVSCLEGKKISVKTANPMTVHADGEIVSMTPAVFHVVPACLQVVCPK